MAPTEDKGTVQISSAVAAAVQTPLISTSTIFSIPPVDTISPYATDLNGVNQDLNYLNRNILWWSIGMLCIAIIFVRSYHTIYHQLRLLSTLSGERSSHRYWARNRTAWFPQLKKHMIYAPIWNLRHNREIQLSKAVGFGTLPSRAHAILLIIYLASNIGYCSSIDYSRENLYSKLAELRGRSGVMAVANMIPLIILSGRNNPLIKLMKVSFDTMNLFHRWVGRMVLVESLVHVLAWAIVKDAATGARGISVAVTTDPFITWGTVSTIAMLLMTIVSVSPIRHAFYETFLTGHILMAIVTFLGVYLHLWMGKLPQLPYLQWVLILWVAERFLRFFWTLRNNLNFRNHRVARATIVELPEDACRVTLSMPKHMDIKPGTHAYIRFASINPWECHPFSIAWTNETRVHRPILASLPTTSTSVVEKEWVPRSKRPSAPKSTTEVSFIVGAKSGMTKKLFEKAEARGRSKIGGPRGVFTCMATLEGPYAGHHSFDSYGTVLLFAGATGITHQLSFLRHLVKGHRDGVVATKKIILVWCVRSMGSLEWVRPWMDEILRLEGRRECLVVKIFVTRPDRPRDVISPSKTVQMYPGRPDIEKLVGEEVESQVGAMMVSVCGPGSMCDNVRAEVRKVQEDGVVDFVEESFTW